MFTVEMFNRIVASLEAARDGGNVNQRPATRLVYGTTGLEATGCHNLALGVGHLHDVGAHNAEANLARTWSHFAQGINELNEDVDDDDQLRGHMGGVVILQANKRGTKHSHQYSRAA